MSLLSTSKVRIYSAPAELKNVVSFLQRKECIEIIDIQNSSDLKEGDSLARLDFAIRYLSEYAPVKKGIRNAVLGERLEVSESDCEKVAMSLDWDSLVSKVSKLEQGRNDLSREKEEKESMVSVLNNWGNVSISMEEGRFSPIFIEVPLQNIDLFLSALSAETSVYELEEISRSKKTVRSIVYIEKNNVEKITSLLSTYKGQKIELPAGASPSKLLKSLAIEVDVIQKKLDSNIVSTVELAKERDSLKMIYDIYLSQKVSDIAVTSSAQTKYISFVEGWVPVQELKLLQYDLEKQFSSILLEELEISKDEIAPVILNASENMKPIQEITKMYGTPAEKELDPTSYYALFFVIFFGFCLTDAGYGLILMLLTGIPLLMKLPFESTVKNVVKMFFYGGISTFILGVLFGGYFGLTTDQVPEVFTYIREADGVRMFLGQVLNPMTDLVDKVMPLTYGLGVFHLFLGFYLSGKIAWSNGDKERMFFVVLPTYAVFIFGGLAFGLGVAGMEYLFYLSLALMVWGLGKSGNPILRVLKGLGGMINEVLSWFQNILSYSRLFALGLATGVIGMAFNIVATTLGGMIPGIWGILVMVLVLVFGHVLNIALNLLGAYVHASRLQFVEFFGLFLEGGGKTFNPLKKEVKYRHLSDS